MAKKPAVDVNMLIMYLYDKYIGTVDPVIGNDAETSVHDVILLPLDEGLYASTTTVLNAIGDSLSHYYPPPLPESIRVQE